jgi:hypothetical protein
VAILVAIEQFAAHQSFVPPLPSQSFRQWLFFTSIRSSTSWKPFETVLHEGSNADAPSELQQGVILLHEDEDEADLVQSLEAMTWLRWLWFVFGTLPPAIKLMSMGDFLCSSY